MPIQVLDVWTQRFNGQDRLVRSGNYCCSSIRVASVDENKNSHRKITKHKYIISNFQTFGHRITPGDWFRFVLRFWGISVPFQALADFSRCTKWQFSLISPSCSTTFLFLWASCKYLSRFSVLGFSLCVELWRKNPHNSKLYLFFISI